MGASRDGGPTRQGGGGSVARFLRSLDPRPLPAILVDGDWYRLQDPRAPRGRVAVRWHFALIGDRNGLSPHPLIEPSRLSFSSAEGERPVRRPVRRYVLDPQSWKQQTHALFDGGAYLERNPDVAASTWNPLVHFLSIGESEGRPISADVDLALVAAQYRSEGLVSGSPSGKYAADTSELGERARLEGIVREALVRRASPATSGSREMPRSVDGRLHVVVLASGDAPLLDDCLESLGGQSLHAAVTVLTKELTEGASAALARWTGVEVVEGSGLVDTVRMALNARDSSRPGAVAVLDANVALDPRALEVALAALEAPLVGAVVGKVLRPDGLIDNAGCVLWSDGGLFRYQALQARESAPSMHARPVDCGSGEFTVFRASTLADIELADLTGAATDIATHAAVCTRIDDVGLTTWFDPEMVAVAMRREARETPIAADLKVVDLSGHPGRDSLAPDHAAHWRVSREPGALMIDELPPVPRYGSGYPRAHALAASVARVSPGHVAIYALGESPGVRWDELRDLSRAGIECHTSWGRAGLLDFLRDNRDRFDTLIVARRPTIEFLLSLSDAAPELLAGKRLIYDTEGIAAIRERIYKQVHGEEIDEQAYSRQLEDELAPARRADVVLAASDSEVDVIAAAGLKNVYALRHAVTVPAHTPGLSNRQGMVFMGRLLEASSPNVDSVRWFLDECLPIIRARHDAPFTVIGAVTAELAAEFEAKGAIVVGALSDVGPALDAARIMVAPTRFAAGMPIKVPDAVAHGTAVVVTPLLRRQLGWVDGLELAVGDGAEDFARAVLELLDDDSLWTRIHEGGLQRVRAEYSTEALDALVATFLA